MTSKALYFVFAYFLIVNGQNIFFDCRREIIHDVIDPDLQKTEAFLETGQNGLSVVPSANGEITNSTEIPNLKSQSYWRLTTSVDTIQINFTRFLTGGAFYVITGIAIKIVREEQCQNETSIRLSSYNIAYEVDGNVYEIHEAKENVNDSPTPILKFNINPVTVQTILIQRSISGNNQYCTQYEIFGCPAIESVTLLNVPIIEYQLSAVPLQDTNSGYTGVCIEGRCIGGIGNLNDGIIGDISEIHLSNQSQFTIWEGITPSLNVTFKLSHYYFVSTAIVYYVEIPIFGFESGKLKNQSQYSLLTKSASFNSPIDIVQIQMPTNSTIFLAITEIEILGKKGENIQTYYRKPYLSQICTAQTTSITTQQPTQTSTAGTHLENSILIVTIGILGIVLLLMAIVIITLSCGIIIISRTQLSRVNKMEDLIKSELHESTMAIAQNRIATYADVDETEISNFRKKLRERVLSEGSIEMDQLSEKGIDSVDQLLSNHRDELMFPKLFPITEHDDHSYVPMHPALRERDFSQTESVTFRAPRK